MNKTDLKHLSTTDIQELDHRYRVNFINSLSGVKSCNLISTISPKGQSNLAIISSVFHLGASPAMLGFVMRPDTVTRDTLENIRAVKYCTLNQVSNKFFKNAHQTSARYPQEVSEFDEVNLTQEYLNGFSVPFVKESKIKASLDFVREINIEENGTHILIFKISNIYHQCGALYDDGTLKLQDADAVAVGGLNTYYKISEIARLAYAKPNKELDSL